MGKQRQRARTAAAKLAGDGATVHPALEPLHCPSCNAPVPLGAGDVATCTFCSAQVPVPEAYRKLRDAESAGRADRAAAEALYQKLGKPSRVLDSWVSLMDVTSGALFTIAMALLGISAVLIFLAGFALEFFLHWIAPLVGIDLVDRFGGGPVYAAFAIGVVALVMFPTWLKGYLHTSGEIRKTLQASLAARAPERKGFPSTCRMCGAALDVPPGALGVRCTYCEADNLVEIPASIVNAAGARQANFHRSIVDAAERARALRAEARAGLPKAARNCAIFVAVFFLVGKGCTALDMDTSDVPTWSDTMTSPRQMSAVVNRAPVPIDTDFTPGLRDYIVALHRHEVIELVSRDDAQCTKITVKNMTTFPFLVRNWDMTWGPQTDGSYGTHWRAPYTGLFFLTIDGIDHGDVRNHLRWRIGTHSKAGLPPAPPFTVKPTSVPAPVALPEAAQKISAYATIVPERRPDVAVVASGEHVELWSLQGPKKLDTSVSWGGIDALAVAPDGSHVAAASDRLEFHEVHGDKIEPTATFCQPSPPVALAYVTPDVLVVAYKAGPVLAHSVKDGRVLYALPAVGSVRSLVGVDGKLVVVTSTGANEVATPRWDPR